MFKKLILFALASSFTSSLTFSQIGNCEEPLSSAILDVGNVQARIFNNGALYWSGGQNLYETPKNSGVNAHFASYFLIGGIMDGELKMASSTYGPYEFWSGPLDADGNPPVDCSIYDRIWEINDEDFQLYDGAGTISDNMRNWPWELGAPVVDGDGIPNNYNLEGGDRPELLGNQTLWWIMNDRGNDHQWSLTKPIGVEVHASTYAFRHLEVGNITFYRYRIFNKNTIPLTDAFLGMFADTDLGNASDDYFGSDSLLHLGYSYNADAIDENGYEDKPPAIGYTFLITPEAPIDGFDNDRDGEVDEPGEQSGMYSARNYGGGGGIQGDPGNGEEMYKILKGLWMNDQPIVEGGTGIYFRNGEWPSDLPVRTTRFMYSGDPGTQSFWTEFRLFPNDTRANPSADRRFTVSSGPFTLQPGENTEFLVALITAHGNDYLDSVRKLKAVAGNLQTSNTDFLFSGYVPEEEDSTSPEQFVLGFDQNFPNPFSGVTTIRYSLPKTMQVRLKVFDMLGREIALLAQGRQEAGVYTLEFNGDRLPAGIYYARLELDHLQFTKKMIRVL